MEEYTAEVTPRQYFWENFNKVIKGAKSMDEIYTYLSNPFHQLDKEPFNINDRNALKLIMDNLEWYNNLENIKSDYYYWINSHIMRIADGKA